MFGIRIITIWLITISIVDISTRRIPVWMLIVGGICAVPAFVEQGSGSLWNCADILMGMLPGVLLLGMGFVTKQVGYGDGLAALILGVVLGSGKSWMLFCVSLFLMAICSILLLALRKAKYKTKIPYLPFLAAGWLLVISM